MRKKPALTKEQIISLATLGKQIELQYGMPMDVEWALENGELYIVQARPITVLPPEWKVPEEGVFYSKGSLAEHLPNPVTPLFATMGLEHINKATKILWAHMFGNNLPKLWPSHGTYTVINGYFYFSCVYKPLLIMIKSLSPRSLREGMMNSVESLFNVACSYFTSIQLCLPATMSSETFFRKFFHKTAEHNGISDMSVFLIGFDTVSLKAEKSLYQNAEWAKQYLELAAYISETPACTPLLASAG